jgi:hypothetical protein
MTTLRDFIFTRKAAIKAEMKALRKELADLKVAEDALETHSLAAKVESGAAAITIKGMIREVLKSSFSGLTSTEILENIGLKFGKKIERTSLSPQLSRMKDDGEVSLDGNFWHLLSELSEPNNDEAEPADQIADNSFGDPDFYDDDDFGDDFDPDLPI